MWNWGKIIIKYPRKGNPIILTGIPSLDFCKKSQIN